MRSSYPTRLVTLVLMAGTIGACAASSKPGSGSSSPSVSTCDEWSELSIQDQQDVVVELYQAGSSNPSQSGASAAIRNVQYHCSQQPNLKLSSIDMDY